MKIELMDLNLYKYQEFLVQFDALLKIYFDEQKEFIYCKKGCSFCCINPNMPLSELEFFYFRKGYESLSEDIKEIIKEKVLKIEENKTNFLKTGANINKFSYDCPVLMNQECILYDFRPIKCRTFGLIRIEPEENNSFKAPECMHFGLNYSNVWDEKIKWFSDEKAKKLEIKAVPEAFQISHSVIITSVSGLDFGRVRIFMDWITSVLVNPKKDPFSYRLKLNY